MMNKDSSLVSIIVPVYNTEKYLEQCVKSLMKQTYNQIEIILVDDGSTDGSSRLCDRYAKEDSRIKVIHKSNNGANSAREEGLKRCNGDYIIFVDSDDWLDYETVEVCLKKAITWNTDCLMFSYIREYINGQFENRLFPEDFLLLGEQCRDKIHRRLIGPVDEELSTPHKLDAMSSICMKFYRVDVAKRARIVNEKMIGTSEDTIFNIYALNSCERIGYINQTFYHYRKTNEQSLTMKYKADLAEKWDSLYAMLKEYVTIEMASERYTTAFYNRVACGMIGLGINEANSKDSFAKRKKRIGQIITKPLYKEAFRRIDIKWCPIQWKVFFVLCKLQNATGVTILIQIMNYLRSRVSN